MKAIVFGAGAVGSVLGALLQTGGHDVTLVGREAHVEAIRRDGLRVEGPRPLHVPVAAHTAVPEGAAADLAIIAVKAYDLGTALDDLAPAVGPAGAVLVAQNGLGNWEEAARRLPDRAVLGASVVCAAEVEAPGRVRWAGNFELTLGADARHREALLRACAWLRQAGIRAEPTDNLAGALWLKAIVNATLTPLSAILGRTHGELFGDPACRDRLQRVCREATRVAQAEGVVLPEPDPWALVESLAGRTPAHRSSMLQSLERGRRTEISFITGRILEAAARHGIPCPENQRVCDEILALERRLGLRPLPAAGG